MRAPLGRRRKRRRRWGARDGSCTMESTPRSCGLWPHRYLQCRYSPQGSENRRYVNCACASRTRCANVRWYFRRACVDACDPGRRRAARRRAFSMPQVVVCGESRAKRLCSVVPLVYVEIVDRLPSNALRSVRQYTSFSEISEPASDHGRQVVHVKAQGAISVVR